MKIPQPSAPVPAPSESGKVMKDCENNQIGGDGDKNQETGGETPDINTEGI